VARVCELSIPFRIQVGDEGVYPDWVLVAFQFLLGFKNPVSFLLRQRLILFQFLLGFKPTPPKQPISTHLYHLFQFLLGFKGDRQVSEIIGAGVGLSIPFRIQEVDKMEYGLVKKCIFQFLLGFKRVIRQLPILLPMRTLSIPFRIQEYIATGWRPGLRNTFNSF